MIDNERKLAAQVRLLSGLLREAEILLGNHHTSEHSRHVGMCPVCAVTGKYPNDIFGRIETALELADGKVG